jgi:hypothetical protein
MQIESLSIEQLVELRDNVIAMLNDRVSARQRELQSEIERFRGVVSSEARKPPQHILSGQPYVSAYLAAGLGFSVSALSNFDLEVHMSGFADLRLELAALWRT